MNDYEQTGPENARWSRARRWLSNRRAAWIGVAVA
ncbi:MAG: hypothetical protein JWM79_890, partial [Nocardioides sp.]|nr:hypothetical protein [Nocardioides sp.]